MPRSTYIYAVMSPVHVEPVATFTVKRELKMMLERIQRDQPATLWTLRVFRMNDGPGGMFAEMTVGEILNRQEA